MSGSPDFANAAFECQPSVRGSAVWGNARALGSEIEQAMAIIAKLGEVTGEEPIRPMSEATPETLEVVG